MMAYSKSYFLRNDAELHEEIKAQPTYHNFSSKISCRQISLICKICEEVMKKPTVLPCLHSFCYKCLLIQCYSYGTFRCFECKREHFVGNLEKDLLPNFPIKNCIDIQIKLGIRTCCFCSEQKPLVSMCLDSGSYLCVLCTRAGLCSPNPHLFHLVQNEIMNVGQNTCHLHTEQILMYYCTMCDIPTCHKCMEEYHNNEQHTFSFLISIENTKLAELHSLITGKTIEMSTVMYARDVRDVPLRWITEYYRLIQQRLLDYLDKSCIRKEDISKEFSILDTLYSNCTSRLKELSQDMSNEMTCMRHIRLFYESTHRLTKPIYLLVYKTAFETNLRNFKFKELKCEFETCENYFIEACFSFVNLLESAQLSESPRFDPQKKLNHKYDFLNDYCTTFTKFNKNNCRACAIPVFKDPVKKHVNPIDSNILLVDYKLFNNIILLQRKTIRYVRKFGSSGTNVGEFSELDGIAVAEDNTIIVPDSNNHRVQVFDSVGNYLFSFGKDEMSIPNLVTINRKSGNIVISERFPRHKINIYSMEGTFIRTFGANVIKHPRAISTDDKGRIIIVESRIKRVHVFTEEGNICYSFSCSNVEFPISVDVNKNNEIFIADNKKHNVKVYHYRGTLERVIGCKGITNFPIAVKITQTGDVVVADNHDTLKFTIFKQDGQLITGYTSKIKQNQCLDFAFLGNNFIVITCVDRQIYIYNFPYTCFETKGETCHSGINHCIPKTT